MKCFECDEGNCDCLLCLVLLYNLIYNEFLCYLGYIMLKYFLLLGLMLFSVSLFIGQVFVDCIVIDQLGCQVIFFDYVICVVVLQYQMFNLLV